MTLQKSNPVRSKRLREAAKGKPCTVRIPCGVCRYDTETTVLAHFSYASSGMGTKPSDLSAAWCCGPCHSIIDGRTRRPHGLLREDIEWCKGRGMAETWGRLVEIGLISVR